MVDKLTKLTRNGRHKHGKQTFNVKQCDSELKYEEKQGLFN